MRPNQVFSTPFLKSMLSVPIGVGVEVEVVAGVEEIVEVVAEEIKIKIKLQIQLQPRGRSIKGQSTLTFLPVIGLDVRCTSDTGGGHFSVPNPPPVHGRIFSLQNLLIIENPASSATLTNP